MKTNLLILATLSAASLLATNSMWASQVVSNVVDDARLQGGTLANTANLRATGGPTASNPGWLEIKSGTSLTSVSRKAYFYFNVGTSLNTNANAQFTIPFPDNTGPASHTQKAQLWALNQAYPGFSGATMTWNNAQANDTNDITALLTDPVNTYTATPLVSTWLPAKGSLTPNYTFTLPGGAHPNNWGQFVKNGFLTLAISGINDPNDGSSPSRVLTNAATMTYWVPAGGGPMPSISVCTNVTSYVTLNSPTNYFTVSPSGLTVSKASDNTAVIPNANINLVNSSGDNWYVYAAGISNGTANITLSITDGSGNPANANFQVQVKSIQPIVSNIPDTNTLVSTAVTVPFTVYEAYSNANNITIWATSLNTNLVLDSGLLVTKTDAGGTNRTVQVTPVGDADGTAPIALWASDTVNSNRTLFTVLVRSSAKIRFSDHFSYTTNLTSGGNATLANNGGSLYLTSGSFWTPRGTSTGLSLLNTNDGSSLNGQALLRWTTASTPISLIAPLAGGPLVGNNDWVVYTSFKATWTGVPQNSGTIVHLYDATTSGTVGLLARVSTSISNSAAGQFRVRIESGENAAPNTNLVEFPTDLTVGTTYNIVTKYVVDATKTTLWVNPTDESSTHVVSVDNNHTVRPVYDVGLRQGTDTGPVLIDDLKVAVVNKPAITSITPPSGDYVNIGFTGVPGDSPSDFVVVSTTDLATAFADVTSGVTITPLSVPGTFNAQVPASGNQRFYSVRRALLTFP
jgi:hypothetical protein